MVAEIAHRGELIYWANEIWISNENNELEPLVVTYNREKQEHDLVDRSEYVEVSMENEALSLQELGKHYRRRGAYWPDYAQVSYESPKLKKLREEYERTAERRFGGKYTELCRFAAMSATDLPKYVQLEIEFEN